MWQVDKAMRKIQNNEIIASIREVLQGYRGRVLTLVPRGRQNGGKCVQKTQNTR